MDKGQGARGRPGGVARCRPGSIGRFLAAAHACLGTARPKRGGQGWRTGRPALRLPPRGGPGRPPTGPPGGGPVPGHSSKDLRRLGCPGPTEDNPHCWWPPPLSPSRRPRVLRNKGLKAAHKPPPLAVAAGPTDRAVQRRRDPSRGARRSGSEHELSDTLVAAVTKLVRA